MMAEEQAVPSYYNEIMSFSKEYFSGARVQIYFGDTFIEEITSLEYTLNENITPIYGFASTTFDKMARGTRIVQGSFTINFTESGYLQTILDRLSNKMTAVTGNDNGIVQPVISQYTDGMRGANIEELMLLEGTSFDDAMQAYEDAMWNIGDKAKDLTNKKDTTYFYPMNANDVVTPYYSEMRDNGFNIFIDFGKNIDLGRITCLNEGQYAGNNDVKTSQTILNVQLMAVSKRMGADNEPVQEVYTFLAKDLDGPANYKY